MTPPRRDEHRWTAPNERLATVAMLIFLLLSVVVSVTVLAVSHDLDHASVTAILGGIGGGAGAALTHKMSSRG